MRCSPIQEKRRIIRTWRLRMAGPPVQPCSSSTSPTAFSLVEQPLHPHGRMSWPSDIWHPDPHTTPAKTLQPHPQTSLQLPTPKILHHHCLAQTKPSVFWPAIEGWTTVVGLHRKKLRYQAFWEQLPRASWTGEAAISTGVLDRKGFFCFHL